MRFARHETFHFREGWLSKGFRKIKTEGKQDIFQRKEAMEELGIGNNMVKSLRYWMQATQLTKEEQGAGKKKQDLTEFGEVIYEYDRYIEEEATLWLLHHQLVTNQHMATTWYWFFNLFDLKEFDETIFISELKSYIEEQGEDIASGSLKKDFDCLINTYLKPYNSSEINPENNLGCPLQELGLIEISDPKEKTYRLTRRNLKEMPLDLFWFCLKSFMEQADKGTEVSIDSVLTEEKSLGKVFNLGLGETIQVLEALQNEGYIFMSKTAGLNYISLRKIEDKWNILKRLYESKMGGRK